jgi:hypothetical protein
MGRLRSAHDANDHWLAADIGERLAWEPRRGHAGRNENENVAHRLIHPKRNRMVPLWRLYGLPEPRKTGYLCAAACAGPALSVHPLSNFVPGP